jgi:hypothetical protein
MTTVVNPFRAGDKVLCITVDFPGGLVVGGTYRVESVSGEFIRLFSVDRRFLWTRFTLYQKGAYGDWEADEPVAGEPDWLSINRDCSA